jgi:hypothetical protein
MTVRDARDLVASEFEGVKRWEDENDK